LLQLQLQQPVIDYLNVHYAYHTARQLDCLQGTWALASGRMRCVVNVV
jgi:hypothetical protein